MNRSFLSGLGRHLFGFFLITAVVLFLHLGLVLPLEQSLRSREASWQSERSKINQLALLKTAQQDLVHFYQALPGETVFPELVSFISESAVEHHLSTSTISYQPEGTEAAGIDKVVISFNVKGKYQDIRKLIDRLEQSDYFLIIENLVLASSSEPGSKAEGSRPGEAIQLQLRLAAYLREKGISGR